MLFYPERCGGKIEGTVIGIAPAWRNGPDLIRTASAHPNIGSIRWLSHALEDGFVLVCPD